MYFQFGYTSAVGEGGIMNFRDYDRKFSPHVVSESGADPGFGQGGGPSF